MRRPARAIAVACLSVTLACATKPTHEPAPSESVGEPVMFVEAPPDPAQTSDPTQTSSTDPSSEQDRERAKALFAEGLGLYEAGDIAEAIVRFEAAYQLAPLPALRFNLARCRQQLGDKLGACADYAEVVAAPDSNDSMRESSLQAIMLLGC